MEQCVLTWCWWAGTEQFRGWGRVPDAASLPATVCCCLHYFVSIMELDLVIRDSTESCVFTQAAVYVPIALLFYFLITLFMSVFGVGDLHIILCYVFVPLQPLIPCMLPVTPNVFADSPSSLLFSTSTLSDWALAMLRWQEECICPLSFCICYDPIRLGLNVPSWRSIIFCRYLMKDELH